MQQKTKPRIDKLSLVQELIQTEDLSVLDAVASLLFQDGASKIPDWMYDQMIEDINSIDRGVQSLSDWSVIEANLHHKIST